MDPLDPTEEAGTWPPTGGTLNTAWLGTNPLMRMTLGQSKTRRQGDAGIMRVEVLVDGKYELVTEVDATNGHLVLSYDGGTVQEHSLVDSRWWLDRSKGQYIIITEYAAYAGLSGYQFEYRDGTFPIVLPEVCRADENGEHWAYVVGNVDVDPEDGSITPDRNSLLVACTSGALGKAISWGFTPWGGKPTDDLDLYRTGVRTVMADYCGDGQSHTEDGLLIQVHNAVAGQDFIDPEAPTEAVFGPDGAVCLSSTRLGEAVRCGIPACQTDADGVPVQAQLSKAWTKLAP